MAVFWSINYDQNNQERIARAAFPHVWDQQDAIGDEAQDPIIKDRKHLDEEVHRWVTRTEQKIEKGSPDWKALVDACHDEFSFGHPEITTDWYLGAIPKQPQADGDMLISALFKKYQKENSHLAESTVSDFSVGVRRFIELFGDIDASKINRHHVEKFRNKLRKLPTRPPNDVRKLSIDDQVSWADQNHAKRIAHVTVSKSLLSVKLALEFGFLETAMFPDRDWRNPFDGFLKKARKTTRNEILPFNDSQIELVFSLAAYHHREPAKFWIPLILLYTGARLDEIAQLHVSDLVIDDTRFKGSQPYFKVENLDDDDPALHKKAKSLSANRYIPLPKQLIEIGFLDYANKMKAQEQAHMFPDLPHNRGRNRGSLVSTAFMKMFRELGSKDEKTGLNTKRINTHSLRHSFRMRGFEVQDQDFVLAIIVLPYTELLEKNAGLGLSTKL